MCGDAGLYASDLCHACVAVDCFMHVYLGLSEVLGRLSAPLKDCPLKKYVSQGAADLRALLRARVQDMRSTAESEGATLDERNMCATVLYSPRLMRCADVHVECRVGEKHAWQVIGISVKHCCFGAG